MIVLFENYKYKKNDVTSLVPEWMLRTTDNTDTVVLPYVGYFFSREANDSVFFLPKIFVDENGLAFGCRPPEDLTHSIGLSSLKNTMLSSHLYSLSMWIYESLKVYRDTNSDTDIKLTEADSVKNLISYKRGTATHTMMEMYFSFIEFNKNNRNVFLRRKYAADKGHKIKWHRTVNRIQPVIQDGVPIYTEHKTVVNRINYEEELLILYYSVINYFRQNFGYLIYADDNYELIKGKKFTDLLGGKALRKLRHIKNNYFSDVFVKMWNLLYQFFDFYSTINISDDYEEVLITDNYPMVFESMIDTLIGDKPGKNGLKKFYADQKDGKRVDHIYRDSDLFSDDSIYFIGDSKYYRTGSLAKGESVEKQFTYAKNIIQYNTDPYSVCGRKARYRDELTEGYNITPNFFISALVNNEYDASKDSIKNLGTPEFSCQFKDRLFDRDTLVVHRYSINFLFVLSAYISKDGIMRESFRKKVRKEFRTDIIRYLNERYVMFRVFPNASVTCEDIIADNFRKLCGKMFSLKNDKSFFIVAYDRDYMWESGYRTVESRVLQLKNELLTMKGVSAVSNFTLPED